MSVLVKVAWSLAGPKCGGGAHIVNGDCVMQIIKRQSLVVQSNLEYSSRGDSKSGQSAALQNVQGGSSHRGKLG